MKREHRDALLGAVIWPFYMAFCVAAFLLAGAVWRGAWGLVFWVMGELFS